MSVEFLKNLYESGVPTPYLADATDFSRDQIKRLAKRLEWERKPERYTTGLCFMFPGETWRKLHGAFISESGIVVTTNRGTLCVRKPETTHDGHHRVGIWANGDLSRHFVHRLVLEAFIGPCPSGFVCCHNDNNPKNNQISNLRWDTQKSNMADKIRHGTRQSGENHPRALITNRQASVIHSELKTVKKKGDIKKVAEKHGVSLNIVYDMKNKGAWRSVL